MNRIESPEVATRELHDETAVLDRDRLVQPKLDAKRLDLLLRRVAGKEQADRITREPQDDEHDGDHQPERHDRSAQPRDEHLGDGPHVMPSRDSAGPPCSRTPCPTTRRPGAVSGPRPVVRHQSATEKRTRPELQAESRGFLERERRFAGRVPVDREQDQHHHEVLQEIERLPGQLATLGLVDGLLGLGDEGVQLLELPRRVQDLVLRGRRRVHLGKRDVGDVAR